MCKSSHSVTADTTIEEASKAAEFFLSDGIIITGSATGTEANVEELKRINLKKLYFIIITYGKFVCGLKLDFFFWFLGVKEAVQMPVIVGSGITAENIQKFAHADAFIVGSSLKYDGR